MKKLLLCALFALGVFGVVGCATADTTAKTSESQNKEYDILNEIRDCEYGTGDCIANKLEHYCSNEKDKSACQSLNDYLKHAKLSAEQMCRMNDALSCHNLGVFYANGYGVKQNFFEAFEFYKKACDLNLPNSCYNLAILYKNGQGVKQNFENTIKLYEKACNANHANACNNLGFLYGNGQGVKQNKSTAKKYFGKACDLGKQMGCDNYRVLNEQGVKYVLNFC